MLTKFIKAPLNRFSRDTDGYVSVESIIVLPAMLWLFGVGWTYFDAFHQQSVNQKANYVIGDMVSRETEMIDSTYVDSAFKLLTNMTVSNAATTDMRIAVVQFDSDTRKWSVVWSQQRGDAMGSSSAALDDTDMDAYQSRLPPGMNNEQLVIVETWEDWHPTFDVGLGSFEITTYSFTSPRYAPQVVFDMDSIPAAAQIATADPSSTGSGSSNAGGNGSTSGGSTSGGSTSGSTQADPTQGTTGQTSSKSDADGGSTDGGSTSGSTSLVGAVVNTVTSVVSFIGGLF
ncbi:TadE/TadG family type IV pilus assembly protein [Sagittula sp. S175]|uniref:TadE/TadG family type IV pilus assembly protein n=1 Tax=Sagittula sp. S175 TaxID=3415129 RepID=UPI003C79D6A7